MAWDGGGEPWRGRGREGPGHERDSRIHSLWECGERVLDLCHSLQTSSDSAETLHFSRQYHISCTPRPHIRDNGQDRQILQTPGRSVLGLAELEDECPFEVLCHYCIQVSCSLCTLALCVHCKVCDKTDSFSLPVDHQDLYCNC